MWHRGQLLYRQQLKFESVARGFCILLYTFWVGVKAFKSSPFRSIYFTCVIESDSIWCLTVTVFKPHPVPLPFHPRSGQADKKTWVLSPLPRWDIQAMQPTVHDHVWGKLIPAPFCNHHKALKQLPLPTLSSSFSGPPWEPTVTSPGNLMGVINLFIPSWCTCNIISVDFWTSMVLQYDHDGFGDQFCIHDIVSMELPILHSWYSVYGTSSLSSLCLEALWMPNDHFFFGIQSVSGYLAVKTTLDPVGKGCGKV